MSSDSGRRLVASRWGHHYMGPRLRDHGMWAMGVDWELRLIERRIKEIVKGLKEIESERRLENLGCRR